MPAFLNRRNDGSLTLFIDGDLQFDSKDESIYHECISLPALFAVSARSAQPLTALIVGGGDGLTARELLKCSRIEKIDLVDYDPLIVALGTVELAALNGNSLTDNRVQVHIADAWKFVRQAIENRQSYDLIVVDLTVARDAAGAKFHSIEWYAMLAKLAGETGVIATNAVSPTATPEAYWSVVNSIRSASLNAVPYRTHIPSFRNKGYGFDWGFVLASSCPLSKNELLYGQYPEFERKVLRNADLVSRLFVFPQELLTRADTPVSAHNSNLFLHYLYNGQALQPVTGAFWNSIEDLDQLPLPSFDNGDFLLPPQLRSALAESKQSDQARETLLHHVLEMVPALQPNQTREMISDFLFNPAAFLEALDLRLVVENLLKRAEELPARIIVELQALKQILIDWSEDSESVLELSNQVLAVVVLVVVLGNLLYPDAAYGKGERGGGAHAAGRGGVVRAGGTDRGGRGRDGDRDRYNHWGYWGGNYGYYGGWARPQHYRYWNTGWNNWGGPYATKTGYANLTPNQSIDAEGNLYPTRLYSASARIWTNPDIKADTIAQSGAPQSLDSAYRLGPDADILQNGHIAMPITDTAYLAPTVSVTKLVNQQTGQTILSLYTEPVLLWHVSQELKHQSAGLDSVATGKKSSNEWSQSLELPGIPDAVQPSETETVNLSTTAKLLNSASSNLGTVPTLRPESVAEPEKGVFELFNSTWATADGKYVIIKRPDGSFAYLDGQHWYSDKGQTKLSEPYPEKFNGVVMPYLQNLQKDGNGSRDAITNDLTEAKARLERLQNHLQELRQQSPSESQGASGTNAGVPAVVVGEGASPDLVEFHGRQIPRSEAIERVQLLTNRAQTRANGLQKMLDKQPAENDAFNKLLTNWGASGGNKSTTQ